MEMDVVEFINYKKSVFQILNNTGADKLFSIQKSIIIKPNLVNSSPFPITTSAEFCEAVIMYIKSKSKAKIIIAEGCGSPDVETIDIFRQLGYEKLVNRYHIKLVDLNYENCIKL